MWDGWNTEHIKEHGLSVEEVEIAARNVVWHKKVKKMRYLAVGRSGTRILSIVIRRKEKTTYYLVTARDADKGERRRLYEREV